MRFPRTLSRIAGAHPRIFRPRLTRAERRAALARIDAATTITTADLTADAVRVDRILPGRLDGPFTGYRGTDPAETVPPPPSTPSATIRPVMWVEGGVALPAPAGERA